MDVKQQIRSVRRRWRTFVVIALTVFVVVGGGLVLSNAVGEGEEASSSLVVIGLGEGRDVMVDSTADTVQVATSLSATAKSPDVLEALRSAVGSEVTRPEISDMLDAQVLPGTAVVQLTVTSSDEDSVVEVTDLWRDELLRFSESLIGSGVDGGPLVSVDVLTGTSVREQVPVSSAGLIVTALVLALLAGTAGALTRDSLDRAVYSSEDAKKAVGYSGAPMSSVIDAGELGPEPSRSDAILRLRARAEVWNDGLVARVICVSGSDSKSSPDIVATALAEALARSAGRVVVVDARVTTRPAEQPRDLLLSDVLAVSAESPLELGVTRVSAKSVDDNGVLEILTTPQGRHAFDKLLTATSFVIVLVDPLQTSTTGQIIAAYTDLVVVVATLSATRVEDIQSCMRAVEEVSEGSSALAKMTTVLVG